MKNMQPAHLSLYASRMSVDVTWIWIPFDPLLYNLFINGKIVFNISFWIFHHLHCNLHLAFISSLLCC